MSNNLNIPDIASGQANKYLLANEQKAALDAAITDLLEVDTSGGPVSISEEDYQRHVLFRVSGGDEVTLPAIRRMVAVEAQGTACSVSRGSTTVELASGDISLIYTDGSSDGLVQVGGSSTGSGGGGGGPDNLGVLATFDMSGGADGQYVASDGNGGAELRDVPSTGGGGTGGIADAPVDGEVYGRKDGEWVLIPSAPGTGSGPQYASSNIWRLLITEVSNTYFGVMVGLTFYDENGDSLNNLIVNVSASSETDTDPVENAVEPWTAEDSGYWSTEQGQINPHWVQVEFSEPVAVAEYSFTGVRGPGRNPEDFQLQFLTLSGFVSISVVTGQSNWVIDGTDTRTFSVTPVDSS